MGLFKRGEPVTVVADQYPGTRDFVGETGTVTGDDDRMVYVRLDGETASTAFVPEELQHRRTSG